MLNKSTCLAIDNVDDVEGFKEVHAGIEMLGIAKSSQDELWNVLGGLLLLGNVEFDAGGDEKALVAPASADLLKAAEEKLGVSNLDVNLTSKGSGRKSLGALKLTKPASQMARDAAIKDIFVHTFDWVVNGINASIEGSSGSSKLPYIGLLDIFGFEVFKHNSFEQLCINFTNEKLQQFFLQAVFTAEEEEHANQGVPLTKVEIQDNQGCIDLLEGKPSGIFLLLDTQCKTPNGSEGGFMDSINKTHAKTAFLVATKTAKMRDDDGFIVRHFAGNVCYHSSVTVAKATKSTSEVPWLEKNNDALDVGWLQKLSSSSIGMLSGLYKPALEAAKNKKGALSVGKRFAADVKSLLDELMSVKPFFIRCIKPNMEKVAKKFTTQLVLEQLRCSGLMGAVKLMQEAYPTRVPYDSIMEAVEKAVGKATVDAIQCHPAVFCEKVMQAMVIQGFSKGDSYAIGKSKLFLKAGGGAFLQDLGKVNAKKLVDDLKAKLEASRKSMHVTLRVGVCYNHWRRKVLKRWTDAAMIITYVVRTVVVKKRYRLWKAARDDKASRALAEANEAERKARLEKDVRDRLATVQQMEEQIKAAELEKISKAEQEAKEKAINAKRSKLQTRAGWRLLRVHYRRGDPTGAEIQYPSIAEQLGAKPCAEALAAAEAEADAAIAAKLEEADRARSAEIEARKADVEAKLRKEVFEGAETNVCQEVVERFADATGKPPPTLKKRTVTISQPNGQVVTPGGGGGGGGIFGGANFTVPEEPEPDGPKEIAKAAGPPKVDGRSRRRTLAGYFAHSEGEDFQMVIETREPNEALGLTIEHWNGELVVIGIEPGSCVEEEGTLMVGDVIVAVDGVPMRSLADVERSFLGGRAGKTGVFGAPHRPEMAVAFAMAEASRKAAEEEGAGGTKKAAPASNGETGEAKEEEEEEEAADGESGGGSGSSAGGAAATAAPPSLTVVEGRGAGFHAKLSRDAGPGMCQDEQGIWRRNETGPEELTGCQFVLHVTRRPLIFTMRTEVEVRMPTGEWSAFMAEVRSNRTVVYEQLGEPNLVGEINLVDLLRVSTTIENGERIIQMYTRHKVIDMRPKPQEARAWQLRLQELLQTREELIWCGWLYKERPDLSDVVTSSRLSVSGAPGDGAGGGGAGGAGGGDADGGKRRTSRAASLSRHRTPSTAGRDRGASMAGGGRARGMSVAARAADEPKWVQYYFMLYGNGVLMYFSDDESAVLGQARGFLGVSNAILTHKAKQRLGAGHHVRFVSGKNANLHAVVVEARHKRNATAKYRVNIESAADGKAKCVDVAATSLSYWYEGADNEPTCEVDSRGIASQSVLTLTGGPIGREETWRLGADTRAAADGWFEALIKYKQKRERLQDASDMLAPQVAHKKADPSFEDVLLASGTLDVLGWDAELSASQQELIADDLARIRNIAANILAMTRGLTADEGPVEEEEDGDPFSERGEHNDYTERWFALRPSGLYFYSVEQRGDEWDEPALTVEADEVLAAASPCGADFYKAVFVLERTSGREMQLRAKSRSQMRRLLGLLHIHCMRQRGPQDAANALPMRAVMMSGWLFLKQGRGVPHLPPITKVMIADGAKWILRWVVLDAEPERAHDARRMELEEQGIAARKPRLVSFESEAEFDHGIVLPVEHVVAVMLQERETEYGSVSANFELRPRKGASLEFAARSEGEAKEWASTLDRVLLTPLNAEVATTLII